MYSEESKSSALAKTLSVYDYVFVDTCSLMEDSFPVFMDTLTASKEYWKDGLRVIVIGECVQELKKHAKSKDKEAQEARIEAKRALKILHHDKWHGKTLEITKPTTTDGFADHALFTQVSSLRIQNKILIITQDKTLATDLKKLNALDSQHGRYLAVLRINQNGDLEENPGENGNGYHRENARPSVSNNTNSRYDNHRGHGLFHRHDRPERPSEERHDSSYEAAPAVESPIAEADRRLCANLLNPNYPKEKKAADINAQLAALANVAPADLEKMSLAFTVDQLKAELSKLGAVAAKTASTPKPVETTKVETAKAEPAKAEPVKAVESPKAAAPVAPAVKPVVKETPKPHGWFEFGRTIEEAVQACGTHEGLLFRDPLIPFFKGVHGPVDLTTDDLKNVAAKVGVLKTGESKEIPLATYLVHVEKTERDYKAYFIKPEVKSVVAQKPAETPVVAVKPVVETKPAPVKPVEQPVEKVATPVKPTRHPRVSKKAEPVASSPVSAPNSNIALPQGATLIVGVPNDNTKAYIERKSRREDNETLSIVKKDGFKAPDKKAPADRPSRKPAPSKKAEAPKKPEQPKKSVPAKKTASPKKPAAAKAPKVSNKKPVSPVAKEDKNLNAKINNPNYPVADKIADLKAQLAVVKGLSSDEQKGLYFPANKLEEKIAELSKK